ncbi:MAG TPA: bifunctional hydroxymethylpyrimidine kinase/phosphomethylpyrimidine kinase [Rhodoblastus sp.]|nr:bifunctional hydroxymethylpyrimidine kinase/phosphomethylpyrimidine kinase [Rhodoblastus sp.]
MSGIPNVLSIAGSDPSGGAGIQADLKTFAAFGCYGMAAITALTAQNTLGVRAVHVPPAEFLAAQIDAIFEDIEVDAVKIGMLGAGEIVAVVADRLAHHGARNIVLDPVLVATSGDSLGAPGVVDALLTKLMPLAAVVTPNIPEAARLVGRDVSPDPDDMIRAGQDLLARGAQAVLVKGGHGEGAEAIDALVTEHGAALFGAPRIATRNTHGTGCSLSSAIAAGLARGRELTQAVNEAKLWLTEAIRAADGLSVGRGHGPLDHMHAQRPRATGGA